MKSEKRLLQWHPAFFADVQIEFKEQAHNLIFQNEYQLSKKPMGIDVLIIKKKTDHPIDKNIGRIFRKYNIVEYKSPTDYLSIDDFYKVYGYSCFYKADTGAENEVAINEITITLVSKQYPQKLIRHLWNVKGYTTQRIENGIYYIYGDIIPIQIIVIGELLPEKNLWLYALTDSIRDPKTAKMLLDDYADKENNSLYAAVMEVVVKANEEQFREDGNMCEALIRLMEEVSGKKMDDLVAEKVAANYEKRLEEKVDSLLEDRLEEKVDSLLEDRLEERVEEAFPKRLEEKVDSLLEDRLEERVEEALPKRLEEKVDSLLEDRLEERVEEAFPKFLEKKVEENVQKRIEEKVAEEKAESIKSVMHKLNLTLEQAMDILQVSLSERNRYRSLV